MLRNLAVTLVLGLCLAGTAATADAAASAETVAPVLTAVPPLCLPVIAGETSRVGFEPELGALAFCEATCTEGPNVSCSGDTCRAVNQNCDTTQGFVECDGVYQFCRQCPCSCSQGAQCSFDSDCDCDQDFGFCDKEVWEIVGTCSCYF